MRRRYVFGTALAVSVFVLTVSSYADA